MISLVTGKPGGGKGRVAIELVADELVKGKRYVITNLPVRVQPWVNGHGVGMIGLKAYLHGKYGNDFDCEKRVFILPDDVTDKFYLYRVVDGVLVRSDANIRKTERDGVREERVMDFDTGNAVKCGGLMYVIDEAWKFFGSRNWQKTGEGMLFYSAQHRHFGDDLFIVTQNTKQIDPAIHRVAENFWVSTNHGNKTLGLFRQPSVFVLAIYDSPPTGAAQAPLSRKVFTLDKKGLAQCYDTSAGVGIVGRTMADIGARKRGLPAWTMAVVAVVGVIAIWKMFALFGWLVSKPFHKNGVVQYAASKAVSRAQEEVTAAFVSKVAGNGSFAGPFSSTKSMAERYTAVDDTNLVKVSGYTIEFGHLQKMYLANGRQVLPSDVVAIYPNDIVLRDGSTLPVQVEPSGIGYPSDQPANSVSYQMSASPSYEPQNQFFQPAPVESSGSVSVYHMRDTSPQNRPPISGVTGLGQSISPQNTSGIQYSSVVR